MKDFFNLGRRPALAALAVLTGLALLPATGSATTVPVPRAAAAYHPDVLDVWVEGMPGGIRLPGQDVEERALAACNRAMGGGCQPLATWEGFETHLAIVRSNDGGMAYAQGRGADAANAAAQALCEPVFGLPCAVVQVLPATTRSYAPKLATARLQYAAGAVVEGGAEAQLIWISSGHPGIEQARGAARAACGAANPGRTCRDVVSVANGVLATFRTGTSQYGTMAATTPARARQAIASVCAERGVTGCKSGVTYPSRGRAEIVHDYRSGKRRK